MIGGVRDDRAAGELRAHERRGPAVAERQYQAMFSIMDTDDDGLISVVEFKGLLDQLGMGTVPEETASTMFSAIDTDGDGRVNLQELSAYLATTAG